MTLPISKLLPSEGWLADYITYTQPIMMTPPEFLLATGLTAVSAAVGRGLYFSLGGKQWSPHIWALLLGRAGHNKSTPINFVRELIGQARSNDIILPNSWSPEAFTDALQNAPDGYWDIGELGAFLGSSRRDHMGGAKEWLCDLWDGRSTKRKLRKETIEIEHPAITAIATARPTDFEEKAGLADFTSGLLSRFLVFPASGTPEYRGMRSSPPKHEGAAYEALSDGLEELAAWNSRQLPHLIDFEEDAHDVFEDADQKWILESDDVPPELYGWAKRRGIQSLKLASLHGLSRHRKPTVEAWDMAWGIEVVRACWTGISEQTVDQIGLDRDAIKRQSAFQKATEIAKANAGVVKMRELLRALWRTHRQRDLDELVSLWIEVGFFERGRYQGARGPASDAIRYLNGTQPPAGWVSKPVHEPLTG